MKFNCKIASKKELASQTWEVVLAHENDDFYFNAGQYVWLATPAGRRAFSIASPSLKPKELSIIFRLRPDSNFLRRLLDMANGENLDIIGPRGVLRAPKANEENIYVAGGVGISPFLSILRSLKEAKLNRKISLIFANSSSDKEFCVEELSNLEDVLPDFHLHLVRGEIRREDLESVKKNHTEPQWQIIGPQGMVDSVYDDLQQMKIPTENIYFEEHFPSAKKFLVDPSDPSPFKKVVNQTANHVIITDANGIILYANASAEKLTGYSFSEMQGQTPRLWGGLMDKTDYTNLWNTIKKDKKPFKGELRNIRKNGEEYDVLATVSPILDDESNLLGFMGIEEDITENKKNKLDLEKLTNLIINEEADKYKTKHAVKN